MWKIIVVKIGRILLALGICWTAWAAKPWITLGDADASVQGWEYLMIDESGRVGLLYSSKQLSGFAADQSAQIWKGSIIQAGDSVVGQPYFLDPDSRRLVLVVRSNSQMHLRVYRVELDLSISPVTSMEVPGFQSGAFSAEHYYFWYQNGLGSVPISVLRESASLQITTWQLSGADPAAITGVISAGNEGAVAHDAFVYNKNGQIWGLNEAPANTMLATVQASQYLPNADTLIDRPLPFVQNGGLGLVGCGANAAYVWESGTGWSALPQQGIGCRDIAVHEVMGEKIVGFIDYSGAWQAIRLVDRTHLVRWSSYLRDLRYIRNLQGNPVGWESGSGWSGFASFGVEGSVWGYYHRRSGIEIGDLGVDPKMFSPSKHGQVLLTVANSSEENLQYRVSIRDDASSVYLLLKNGLLDYGLNSFRWDGVIQGSLVDDGKYWLKVESLQTGAEMALEKPFVVDNTPPAGSLEPAVAIESGDTLWEEGALVLNSRQRLILDARSIVDSLFLDSQVVIKFELRHLNGGVYRFPWTKAGLRDTLFELDGTDFAGNRLPQGRYSIAYTLEDVTGNRTPLVDSLYKDGFVLRQVVVRGMNSYLTASINPMLIRSFNSYTATLQVRVFGQIGEALRLSAAIGEDTLFHNWISIGQSSVWDTLITQEWGALTHRGRNALTLTLRDSLGLWQSVEVPIIKDEFETVITSPVNGDRIDRLIEIRGIAAAPNLNDSGGFARYRVYAVSGHHQLDRQSIQTISALYASLPLERWYPLQVPLWRQSEAMIRATTYRPKDTIPYPRSNIGGLDATGNSVLAFLDPTGITDTLLTLIVVSEELSAVGSSARISFDTKEIVLASGFAAAALSLELEDVQNTSWSLDLTDTQTHNDSLPIRIRASGGSCYAVLSVLEGDVSAAGAMPGQSHRQVLRAEFMLTEDIWYEYLFNGRDYSGHPMDGGPYTIQVTCVASGQGAMAQTYQPIQVKFPVMADESRGLKILPNPLEIVDSVVPSVQISIDLNQTAHFSVVAENLAKTKYFVIADSVESRNGVFTWDLRDSAGVLFTDGEPGKTHEILISLLPLESGWLPVRDTLRVHTGIILLAEQPWDSQDLAWEPEVFTDFKFRAKARASLQYFPARRVSYGPYAQGQQVVRYFKDVPYTLEYAKYYNSLETITNTWYKIRVRVPGHGSESKDNYSTVYSSFYAAQKDRMGFPVIKDSALVSNRQDWYGDPSYYQASSWTAAERAYAKHKCPPIFNEAGFPMLPPATDECKAFALGGRTRIYDGPGDDRWRNIEEGYFHSYLLQRPAASSVEAEGSLNPGLRILSLNRIFGNDPAGFEGANKPQNYYVLDTLIRPRSQLPTDPWGYYRQDAFLSEQFMAQNYFHDIANNLYRYKSPYPGTSFYWTDRGSWRTRTRYSYYRGTDDLMYDDDEWPWNNDALYQKVYTNLPYFNWMHPYLVRRETLRDTINYYNRIQGGLPDVAPWDVNALGGSQENCHTHPFPADERNSTDGAQTFCYTDGGGIKIGQRGFAYRFVYPSDNSYFVSKAKGNPQIRAQDMLHGYFDRTPNTGHVFWEFSQSQSGNRDNLVFRPMLSIGNPLFGISWDSLSIPFPAISAVNEYVERDSANRILAFCAGEGPCFHSVPFEQDTALWPVLRSPRFASEAIGAYVDSVYVDFLDEQKFPQFAELLSKTDSALIRSGNDTTYYGYIRRASLRFLATLRSQEIGAAGAAIVDNTGDTARMFLDLRNVDNFGDSLGIWIYYRNKPLVDEQWSSEQDSLFSGTQGYLYGKGPFNANGFRSTDNALPDTGVGGFLEFVGSLGLWERLTPPTPESRAPFNKDTIQNKVIYNPNIIFDDFRWDLQVFQYDGELLHGSLDTLGATPENFALSLRLNATPKAYVRIQKTLPPTMDYNGKVLSFDSYRLYFQDGGGLRLPIPVNRFYRGDSADIYSGTLLPDYSKDLWNQTERYPGDTLPTLAFWDVTRRNGSHRLVLDVRYKDPAGVDTLYTYRWHRDVSLGTPGLPMDSAGFRTIHSPYRRATLQVPANPVFDGSLLSVYSVAPGDIEWNRENLPDFQPVGPILELQTSGTPVFTEPLPVLSYRFSAEEFYSVQGLTTYTTDGLSQIRDSLQHYSGSYRIYLLGENTRLEPLSTLATLVDMGGGESKADIYLELSASVPHFSYALLLQDSGHEGYMPRLRMVEIIGDSLHITGDYGYGFAPDSVRFGPGNMPTDLVLFHSTHGKLSEVPMNSVVLRHPELSSTTGQFEIRIPQLELSTGENNLYLMYAGSSMADRRVVRKADSTFDLRFVSDGPDPLRTQCGALKHRAHFIANRNMGAIRQITDARGAIVALDRVSFVFGDNAIGWDGCQDQMGLPPGRYLHQYFPDSLQSIGSIAFPVAVGDSTYAELLSLGVTHGIFQPNPQVASHTQKISVATTRVHAQDLRIGVRRLRDGALLLMDAIEPVGTTGRPGVYQSEWNGLWDSEIAEAGDYRALAWLSDGDATPLRADFKIGPAQGRPVVALQAQPQPWKFPSTDAVALVTTDKMIAGRLWWEDAQGLHRVYLAGSQQGASVPIHAGKTNYSVDLQDSSQPLPARLVLEWSYQGSAERTELALLVAAEPPVLGRLTISPSDTIYPDFPEHRMELMRSIPARGVEIGFATAQSATIRLDIRNAQTRLARFEYAIPPGSASILWDGRDNDGQLLKKGDYSIEVWSLAPHTSGMERRDTVHTIHLQRLPQLVIALDDHPSAKRGIQTPQAVAEHLLELLDSMEVRRLQIMNYAEVRDYMQYKPDGIVVFVSEVPDEGLHTGRDGSLTGHFIANGGKVVFFNQPPVMHYFNRTTGEVFTDSLSSLRAFGYLRESQSELSRLYQRHFRVASPRWADPGQVDDLRYYASQQPSGLWQAVGMTRMAAARIGGVLAPITAAGVGNILDTVLSYYYQLPRNRSFSEEPGALLTVYPYNLTIDNANRTELTQDLAASIYRYFFAEDLVLTLSEESVTNKNGAARILHGDTLVVQGSFRWTGDNILDSAVLRVTGVQNGGFSWDSVIYAVPRHRNIDFIMHMPVAVGAPFDSQSVEVHLDPFRYVIDVQGVQDTVREKNIANNHHTVNYVVADDQAPILRVDSLEGTEFWRYYSPLAGKATFDVGGMVATRHKKGVVQLSVQVTDSLGRIVYTEQSEVDNAEDENRFTTALHMLSGELQWGHYQVRYRALDKYGNDSTVVVWLKVDSQPPIITQYWLPNALSVDSSQKLLALAGEQPGFTPDPSALALEYIIGAGVTSVAWAGRDNLALLALRIRSVEGELVLEQELTSTPDQELGDQQTISLSSGLWSLELEDRAGNIAQAYVQVLQDTTPPWIELFATTRILLDSIRAGLQVDSAYLANRPLYMHNTAPTPMTDDEMELAPHAPLPDGRYTAKIGGQPGDWSAILDADGMDTLRMVVNGLDNSAITWELRINRALVSDPLGYNPYLEPANPRLLENPYRGAVRQHRNNLYLEIPIGRTDSLIQITSTDAAGNTTAVSLQLRHQGVQKYEDAPGDRSALQGPDFGDIYLASETLQDQRWLHVAVHSYEMSPSSEIFATLYMDLDGNGSTGSAGVLATQELGGFEYRVQMSPPSLLDSDTLHWVRLQTWTGTQWITQDSATAQQESAGLRMGANQANLVFTPSLGEGHQVMPSGKVALAPGGFVEFSVRLPAMERDTLLFYIEADADLVLDTATNGPLALPLLGNKTIRADGAVADWYGSVPPLLASLVRLQAQASSQISADSAVYRLAFDLVNAGYRPNDSILLQYRISLAQGCSAVVVTGEWANQAFMYPSGLIRANRFPEYAHLDSSHYLVQVQIAGGVVTGGTHLQGMPAVTLTGTGCRSDFATDSARENREVTVVPWETRWFQMPGRK